MIKGNLHTHTYYCDGKNAPEEIVKKAIEKGFSYIGFSGHGHTRKDSSYCMSPENTKKYINCIFIKSIIFNNRIYRRCYN